MNHFQSDGHVDITDDAISMVVNSIMKQKEKIIKMLNESFVFDGKRNFIVLNGAEIQSGSNRQRHAEHLISQLCKEHDGRNTWLLNYGVGEEAVKAREVRSIRFDDLTQSAETIKS